MLTLSESVVTVSGKPSKSVQLLRKRLRQLLRVVVVLAACIAVAATAFAIWWFNSLNGLPDIGDPFDVAAFRTFSIPDDQNAFAFLRRAIEKTTPIQWGEGPHPDDPKFSWSIAHPNARKWAEENREALVLFLQGADSPDAAHPAEEPTTRMGTGNLDQVAFFEGSRRQENGDMAGAWKCYRAVLRMITHFRRRGNTLQRQAAKYISRVLQRRLTDWATDPRTTPVQLHTALEEALKNEQNPDWDISAIKSWYLELMGEIERPMPHWFREEIEREWTHRLGDMALLPTTFDYLEPTRRFLLREPERSRRVLRLLCAHYLANAETRGLPRPKPDVWVKLILTQGAFKVPLYPVSPEAPAGARALTSEELARWLVATQDARLRINDYELPWPPERVTDFRVVADRKAHRQLVVMLATELYHRERGSLPPSDEALVGTYLKSLPNDRSPDVDDGTAPMVE
jgi:hypothetical protein